MTSLKAVYIGDIPIFVVLQDKMVNLGLIDFQMGLPLNIIIINDGQNKFGVHISKNMARIANFRPK